MNLLLTGASGFLGRHIYAELIQRHTITTLGRTPLGLSHIVCDLSKTAPTLPNQPIDYVIHVAGKAHSVPRNTRERAEYARVNVRGTAYLLNSLTQPPELPKAFVFISSVLVYGRTEGENLTESTPLNAVDAYGSSKAQAERLVQEWGQQTGVRVTILRLPLVAAYEPVGNLAAMQRTIQRGYYFRVGDGQVRRSMVRADDVARILEKAAETGGTYHLTDGCHPTVRELEDAFARQAGRNGQRALPMGFAQVIARVGDGVNRLVGRRFPLDSIALQKLTSSLTFSDDAARKHLGWSPQPVLNLFQ